MSKLRRAEPAAGDLVAFELRPGVFSMIWIIATSVEDGVRVLVMDGTWRARPTADELAAARPARASGPLIPGYDDVWKGWFRGRVPADFETVGRRRPSAVELAYADKITGTMIFGDAESIRSTLRWRWRWEHERAAVEAESAAAEAKAEQRTAKRRATMTLPKMLRERIFAGWSERCSPRALREMRRIFRDATNDLIALERAGTKRERTTVLRRITTELNDLDDKEGCIETDEREALVARIEELARLVGVTNVNERLTRHRDW
jgi:hypothetical protein